MKPLNLDGLEPIPLPDIPNRAQINRDDFAHVEEKDGVTVFYNTDEKGVKTGVFYSVKKDQICRSTVENGAVTKVESRSMITPRVEEFAVMYIKDGKIYKEISISGDGAVCLVSEVKQKKDGEFVEHGRVVKYYHGRVSIYCEKRNGKAHGKEYLFEAGALKTIGHYRDGLKHGMHTTFNKEGTPIYRYYFDENRLVKRSNLGRENPSKLSFYEIDFLEEAKY